MYTLKHINVNGEKIVLVKKREVHVVAAQGLAMLALACGP